MARKTPSKAMRYLRWLLPGSILAFMFGRGIIHNLLPEANVPSVDALCPLGGALSIYRLIDSGQYLQKIHPSSLVMLIGLFATILLTGGAFCGWICPFGTLQDWLQKLRQKLGITEVEIPAGLAAKLAWLRWVLLFVIIYFTVSTTKLWFADYDPYRTIFSVEWLFSPSLEHWPAYLIAVLFIVGSVLIRRLWCRFLCPLGAIITLLQPLGLIKVKRDADLCVSCGKCDKVCPSALQPSKDDMPWSKCNSCLECVEACPIKGALAVKRVKSAPIGKAFVPVVAVLAIALSVTVGNLSGLWLTSGKEIFDQKAAAGTITADDIRGWMTMQQIADFYQMPIEYLYTSLGIELADIPLETELRDLENQASFETGDVRIVAQRFQAGEPAQVIFELDALKEGSEPTVEEHQQPELTAESTVIEIKGRMSLKEIADAFKLPLAELITKSGLPENIDVKMPLRDLKTVVPEFEVSQVRDAVEAMLAQ